MSEMEVEHVSMPMWAFSLIMPGMMMVVQVITLQLAALLNPSITLRFNIKKLQSISFAMCWQIIGNVFADDFPAGLEKIIDEKCNGRVMDIGPGSGYQLKRFKGPFQAGKIQQIYAIEPGVEMHDELKANAIKTFSGDASKTYRVLTCGAQPNELIPALAKEGVLGKKTEGVFDTIVCIRVLCGIPQPQETVDLFYRLLKPGGVIIFFEHVVNNGQRKAGGSLISLLFQRIYMFLGWPFLAGGCELTRDTVASIRQAASSDGGWAQERVVDRKPEACIPEAWGYMTKRF